MVRASDSTADLVLGWTTTEHLQPHFWARPNARPGAHRASDLVAVQPASMARHTAIVGQSGSARSYFLGRIVEEIALKTRSAILVFDQSTSFRRIADIKTYRAWADARYDPATMRGFLPDEPSRAAFVKRWSKTDKRVYTKLAHQGPQFSPLQLSLDSLPIDILFYEFGSQSNELMHCHNFVRCVRDLTLLTPSRAWREGTGVLDNARELIASTVNADRYEIVSLLRSRFLEKSAGAQSAPIFERAATHRSFISQGVDRLYFSVLASVLESGLLPVVSPSSQSKPEPRIKVVDVPSIYNDGLQTVVIGGFLDEGWRAARRQWQEAALFESALRSRVPLFIVVDEAHSVIPAEPGNSGEAKLRDRFRDIAADGTKFGVYLVLMTYRPDRIDPRVLSDCENRGIMKLGSVLTAQMTSQVLGLDNDARRALDRAPSFPPGCALMCGPWAENGLTYVVSAARRTEEGALHEPALRKRPPGREPRQKKGSTIRLASAALDTASTNEPAAKTSPTQFKFQCFVSYASEDRAFVKQLVDALSERKITVWWDRGQITLGDKLSAKIDEGLRQSRYGLVIVSPSFVRKKWTNEEIRALSNRAVGSGQKVVLPVLVDMTYDEFSNTYPLLGDALSTTYSGDIDELVVEIMQAIA